MTSNCCKVLAFALLFCWIGMPQSLADVVTISASEQLSVSGYVTACDPLCQTLYNVDHEGQGFSSASTDGYAEGSATDLFITPDWVRGGSIYASASQLNNVAAGQIALDLSMNADDMGNTNLMEAGVTVDSQYSLVFDLTTPSLVHLVGMGLAQYIGVGGPASVTDSSFGGDLHLTGPGFQFDQDLSYSPGDAPFTLGPGQYTLNEVTAWDIQQYYDLGFSSEADLSLTADFTSIPEPLGTSTVLGVSMVVALYFARKRAQDRLSA
jgi:hypothetical protein